MKQAWGWVVLIVVSAILVSCGQPQRAFTSVDWIDRVDDSRLRSIASPWLIRSGKRLAGSPLTKPQAQAILGTKPTLIYAQWGVRFGSENAPSLFYNVDVRNDGTVVAGTVQNNGDWSDIRYLGRLSDPVLAWALTNTGALTTPAITKTAGSRCTGNVLDGAIVQFTIRGNANFSMVNQVRDATRSPAACASSAASPANNAQNLQYLGTVLLRAYLE